MTSLKAFLPVLSRNTDLSVTALYERQRMLVRLGLLPKPTKSGRNSGGAMATPGTVAVMLTSILVTDNLSEMDEGILDFLMLRAYPFEPWNVKRHPLHCPFTGERTFYRALRKCLADGDFSATLAVEVVRKLKIARLVDMSGEHASSEFGLANYHVSIEHRVSFSGLFQISCELEDANPTRPQEETAIAVRAKRIADQLEFDDRTKLMRQRG
jgi:hypothetical protein